MTKKECDKIQSAEMQFLRNALQNRIRNEDIRAEVEVKDTNKIILTYRRQWWDHLQRLSLIHIQMCIRDRHSTSIKFYKTIAIPTDQIYKACNSGSGEQEQEELLFYNIHNTNDISLKCGRGRVQCKLHRQVADRLKFGIKIWTQTAGSCAREHHVDLPRTDSSNCTRLFFLFCMIPGREANKVPRRLHGFY